MALVDTPDDQLITVDFEERTPDDWQNKQVISISELATRLGARQHFDNRGRMIWTEGFESAILQWTPTLTGTGTLTRSNVAAWNGSYSLCFDTAAVVNDAAQIDKSFYNPLTGRYSFEFAWASSAATCLYFSMDVEIYDGTNYYRANIYRDGKNPRYQWMSETAWYNTLGAPPYIDNLFSTWHKCKLVIDADLREYVRILVDGNEFDLTGNRMWTAASALLPHIRVYFRLLGDALGAYNVYMDDFIFSHLEP